MYLVILLKRFFLHSENFQEKNKNFLVNMYRMSQFGHFYRILTLESSGYSSSVLLFIKLIKNTVCPLRFYSTEWFWKMLNYGCVSLSYIRYWFTAWKIKVRHVLHYLCFILYIFITVEPLHIYFVRNFRCANFRWDTLYNEIPAHYLWRDQHKSLSWESLPCNGINNAN